MSKFDERMLKPSSHMFYFQLVPILIQHKLQQIPKINQWASAIIFKLYKGQQLCDETKKPIPIVIVNKNVIVNKVFINFNLPVLSTEKIVQFSIKIYGIPKDIQGKQTETNGIQDSKKQMQGNQIQIGSYKINANDYIDQYKQNNRKQFKRTVQINQQLAFSFQLFIQKSRFALQKYIRKIRQQRKQQARKNMIESIKRADYQPRHMATSPTSEKISEISQNYVMIPGQNRFISPGRTIIKNKKLIVRNSSVKKSNATITEQARSLRDSKSVLQKKSSQQQNQREKKIRTKTTQLTPKRLEIKQKLSPNQGRKSFNDSQIDDPLKDYGFPQDQCNYNNTFMKKAQKNQELNIQITSSNIQEENSKVPKKKQTPQKQKKKKTIEKTSDLFQKQKPQISSKPTNMSINLMNFFNSKAFIVVFVIFSFILLINVMKPSKKV